MRKTSFVIFFSVALTVYAVINFYVGLRAWEVLSFHPALKLIAVVLVATLAASFILGRVLERIRITRISTLLVWIGSFWLAAMTYLVLSAMTIDILRLSDFFVPWFPSVIKEHPAGVKDTVAVVVTLSVVVVVLLGHVNAIRPRIRTLNLSFSKPVGAAGTLNAVSVSDIHLGTIVGKRRLERIVAMINGLNPDIVFLPGDVFDEDIGPVIRENLGEILRTIRSRFGVFAITGNHEYIGGEEAACQYLGDHGIVVLRDSSVRINDTCYVVGREDISIRQFAGKRRKDLAELLTDVDTRLPVIVLDHQPFRLEEAEQHGIDLQLSGHTHHGQLWPFNYISQRIFEVSWGYKRKGATHIYVSCGVGTWGPPVRVGNTPEIVNLKISAR